ncbi:MAG: hypothetical protein LBV67_01275 [Streptococcaceae bacterium]|nr:hypothetical protein [Streptococcaceae bacterium]
MSLGYRTGIMPNMKEPGTLAYYNRVVIKGVDDLDRLARRISAETGIKRGVVLLILTSLEDIALERMGDGYAIELGGLGRIYLSIQSELVTEANELGAKHIKKAKINFKPGKSFTEMAKNAKFEAHRNYKDFSTEEILAKGLIDDLADEDVFYEDGVVQVQDDYTVYEVE